MLDFKIDAEKCINCGACAADCPSRIITMSAESKLPEIAADNEEKCMKCQHCYTICPTGALSIFKLDPQNDSIPLNKNTLPDPERVETLERGRRSTRKYKQENVSKDLIQRMVLAAANCPTAVNNCALRFDVIADIDQMNDIRSGIMEKLVALQENEGLPAQAAYLEKAAINPWKKHQVDGVFRTAPHALIVSASSAHPFSNLIDVSIALSYFELIANANGVGTTWCGLLKQSLELLPEYKNMLVTEGASDYYCMLFGHPAIKYARTANRDQLATVRYI